MLLKYQVRHGKSKLVSQHRTLLAATKGLKRLMRNLARKGDKVVVIHGNRGRIERYGDFWIAPTAMGVLVDAKGKERHLARDEGFIFRILPPSMGPSKRRSSRRYGSQKRNSRRSR